MKLSVLCEQDRILQDLEDKIRALKENKVNIAIATTYIYNRGAQCGVVDGVMN